MHHTQSKHTDTPRTFPYVFYFILFYFNFFIAA